MTPDVSWIGDRSIASLGWNPSQAKREFRPFREYGMTVCIAALCEDKKRLILAADHMIGDDNVQGESDTPKVLRLQRNWRVMISANDLCAAVEIVQEAKKNIRSESASADEVRNAVMNAYTRVREQRALHESLGTAWTLKEFKRDGRAKLPVSIHKKAIETLAEHNLEVSLLVCGFDQVRGSIFQIEHPGVCLDQSRFGYAVIGSGFVLANASLVHCGIHAKMSLEEAAYYVVEAKAAAERAPGVGLRTDLRILRKGREKAVQVTKSLSVLRNLVDRHKGSGASCVSRDQRREDQTTQERSSLSDLASR